jgi:hypothetical protein
MVDRLFKRIFDYQGYTEAFGEYVEIHGEISYFLGY